MLERVHQYRLVCFVVPFVSVGLGLSAVTFAQENAHHASLQSTVTDAPVRWDDVRVAVKHGHVDNALSLLERIEQRYPEVADRVSLRRGQVLLSQREFKRAERAFYFAALKTVDSTVRARARLGRVRAMVRGRLPRYRDEMKRLFSLYPNLPHRVSLELDLARHWEQDRRTVGQAISLYRTVMLDKPGTADANTANARLQSLRTKDLNVRELTVTQRVIRLERAARVGPAHFAKRELDELLAMDLPSNLAQRVALVGARISRSAGDWARASELAEEATQDKMPTDPADLILIKDAERAAQARRQDSARGYVRKLKGRRPWERVRHSTLARIIDVAARAGLQEPLDEALRMVSLSKKIHPHVAFRAAIVASGVGNDAHVASIFQNLLEHRRFGVASRYHFARAMERAGKLKEAEVAYLEVKRRDRSETRFYALLSEQRLWAVHERMLGQSLPAGLKTMKCPPLRNPKLAASANTPISASGHPGDEVPVGEGLLDVDEVPAPVEPPKEVPNGDLIELLRPVVEAHGEAYPWLERAVALLQLGDRKAASDELHEVYIAWRHARGRPQRRVGLEAVFHGKERPRTWVNGKTRRDRRKLSGEALNKLVDAAIGLGDEGTAVALSGWERVKDRPRAYESRVVAAAHMYKVDPNLLLAVMRTESVYQKRIVSYAGAVGLMQIMPKTGQHIAHVLKDRDFSTDKLLIPEVNIHYAAWYLSSLIERFQGRLPLAIAAYNGGPHNVRRWMVDHSSDISLDAFLERIPFAQTHRYVRRVLSHYAAYRKQQGLRMQRLSMELPDSYRDTVGF